MNGRLPRPAKIRPAGLAAFLLLLVAGLSAQDRGIVAGPEKAVPVFDRPGKGGTEITRLKPGQVFAFQSSEGGDRWKVVLPSGREGWIEPSTIRRHHTLDEIPEVGEEGSEVLDYGRSHGFDYHRTAHDAARGQTAAMERFFGITDTDGAAAESHAWYLQAVVHVLGDGPLAAFLEGRDLDYRLGLRRQLGGVGVYPFEPGAYLKRHFPRTSARLFSRELTDWPSPDGRFSIRKVFSTEWPSPSSEVERAEVVENGSGRVAADFTADDPGDGAFREGRILWSPDSRKFASFAGGIAGAAETVVFRWREDRFEKLERPAVALPAQPDDEEARSAHLEWSHVEPLRWVDASVLVLQRHDYHEGVEAGGRIFYLGRTWELRWNTATGEVAAERKVW